MSKTKDSIDRLLTNEERTRIRDGWFASLPRGDNKRPRDLEIEAQRDLTAKFYEARIEELIEEIEKGSHPVNTNMTGINYSRWSAYYHGGSDTACFIMVRYLSRINQEGAGPHTDTDAGGDTAYTHA